MANNNNLNTLAQQIQNLQQQYQSLLGNQSSNFQNFPVPAPSPIPVQVPIPVPSRQVQYVEGISGAKLYQDNLPSNSSEVIMDKDENIFYLVSKDANGTPSKHITRCRFEIEDYQEEEPAFLTRKDFDDFKEEIRQMFANNSQPTQKQVTLSSNTPKATISTQKIKE